MLWLVGSSTEAAARLRSRLRRRRSLPPFSYPGGTRRRPDRAAHPARNNPQGSRGPDQLSGRPHRSKRRGRVAPALREAHEEIGLTESFIEFAGYLPDHWVGTGFRITPVVAFVNPRYELRIATAEVHDVFEVPLAFILDEANHKVRRRELAGQSLDVYDIPMGTASSGVRRPACC